MWLFSIKMHGWDEAEFKNGAIGHSGQPWQDAQTGEIS